MDDRCRDLCSDCANGAPHESRSGYYKCRYIDDPPRAPSHCLFYDGPRIPVDVVIITAARVEYDAVLDELHPAGRIAWRTLSTVQNGRWRVSTYGSSRDARARLRLALGLAAIPGLPAAAALTALAIQVFCPSHVAMVGITAGRQGEVNIGDVIVPRELWDYGAGKWEDDNKTRKVVFRPRSAQKSIEESIRQACHDLGDRTDNLSQIRNDWADRHRGIDFPIPKVHIGPMVSGAAVINAEEIWKQVLSHNDKIIALDMEAYGVLYAAATAAIPLYRPLCVIMKSVCDYGVSKTDWAQSYAAYTSVKFFKSYLEEFILDDEYHHNPVRVNVRSA